MELAGTLSPGAAFPPMVVEDLAWGDRAAASTEPKLVSSRLACGTTAPKGAPGASVESGEMVAGGTAAARGATSPSEGARGPPAGKGGCGVTTASSACGASADPA